MKSVILVENLRISDGSIINWTFEDTGRYAICGTEGTKLGLRGKVRVDVSTKELPGFRRISYGRGKDCSRGIGFGLKKARIAVAVELVERLRTEKLLSKAKQGQLFVRFTNLES